ncbi:hypothetical protein FC093_11015 [Ilyomonas limi]|uniref:Uncharacterized protein n=1 Tax=Ilyomonas limi TaxID=2575867 RepID=A0A4U3L2Y7_9BACT|nr:hypothetical protein [Ilyomonas limi]TKK68639.1 hypothetical protein FC093_11015 [Ilyomonas limi]
MINLSNYEEYFLLYIDNELSKEQCEAVETFVLQHPHLAAELNMLREAKLPLEDAIVYSNKNALYKTTGSSINSSNYEEYFLLHTDKELSVNEEAVVEQFVLQHPQLQEAFLLLQQAKLTPEVIACPDKHRLYKQPAKRIIPLYITRMAVAAAIMGVIILTGNYLINNDPQPQVAVNTQPIQHQPVEKNTALEKEPNVVLPEKKSNDNNIVVAKNEVKQSVSAPAKSTVNTGKSTVLPDTKQQETEQIVVAQIEPLPIKQPAPPAPEELVANNSTTPKQKQPTVLKPLEEVDENAVTSTVAYTSNDYTTTKPAVYKELNTEEDDRILYVGSLQLNKNKVNGLLKKATHLLGGKAKEQNL